jgi:four helix bundle protein
MRSNFRELDAYRRAAAISDELYRVIAGWDSYARWSVGLQLQRAVDSIGANIAEGCGRWTKPDEKRFLVMARASLYEAEHWIARAADRGLLAEEWLVRLADVARPLSGLIAAHRSA